MQIPIDHEWNVGRQYHTGADGQSGSFAPRHIDRTKCDWTLISVWELKSIQVLIDVGIEINFPLLHQPHNPNRRQSLRDRCCSPKCAFQVDGTVTFRNNKFLIIKDEDSCGSDPFISNQRKKVIVRQLGQINRVCVGVLTDCRNRTSSA